MPRLFKIFPSTFDIFRNLFPGVGPLKFMSIFPNQYATRKVWSVIEKDEASESLLKYILNKMTPGALSILANLLPTEHGSLIRAMKDKVYSTLPHDSPAIVGPSNHIEQTSSATRLCTSVVLDWYVGAGLGVRGAWLSRTWYDIQYYGYRYHEPGTAYEAAFDVICTLGNNM